MTPKSISNTTRISVTVAVALGLAALLQGCSPTPTSAVAAINDKIYPITSDAIRVKSGPLTGDLTDLKVTERIEEGTGRIVNAAKLTGKLVLKNTSTDQSIRFVEGKLSFIDARGNNLKLEDSRAEPVLKFASGYGTAERLDPGQESAQSVEVEFPVAALKADFLKEIRLGLSYLPTPFKSQALSFGVSVDAK